MVTEEYKNNPLMEKRKRALPGITVRLPSRGEVYESGVLSEDVEDGEVVVFPMRLREELKMKSLDAIFQGSAVSDTISYCVPQVLKPEELCPPDVDYLMTAIKRQTHGDDFVYRDVCMKIEKLVDRSKIFEEAATREYEELDRSEYAESSLEEISEQLKTLDKQIDNPEQNSEKVDREFDPILDNINNLGVIGKFCEFHISLSYFLNNSRELDPEVYEENKRFNFEGFNVELKHISFNDFREISNLRLKDDPVKMSEDEYYEYINKFSNVNIARRIRSVDNINDQDMIEEWVNSFQLSERTKLLEEIYKAYDWGIDFEYNLTCSACGKSKKLDMSYLNPLYFFLIS